MFGRRQKPPTPPPPLPAADGTPHPDMGHYMVLQQLREKEETDPVARPQLVGNILFRWTSDLIRNKKGIHAESLVGILAALGGFSCILAALDEYGHLTKESEKYDLVISTGKDGHRYFFGDVPNRYLLETRFSLLNIALSAAQAAGTTISTDVVHEGLRHVAATVGGEAFGVPRLPPEHPVGDLPVNYVQVLWPNVLKILALYEVAPQQFPATFGFALYRAITEAKQVIDPALAFKITLECAAPMAKLDPARIGHAAKPANSGA